MLIGDLLEERNPSVSFLVEDDLWFMKENVQRRLHAKHLVLASGLELVAVVAEPLPLAVLHQVVQLFVNLDLPLATDLSQQRRAVLR
jgi:hypothetical protein